MNHHLLGESRLNLPITKKPPLFLPDVVSGTQCEEIRKAFLRDTPRPRSYQGIVDDALRNAEFVFLPEDLSTLLDERVHRVIEEWFDVELQRHFVPSPIIYRYPVGVGFLPHHDMVTSLEMKRGETNQQPVLSGDFTVILFVSHPSDFGGGELYFPDLGCEFKPSRGAYVVFPASEDYIHGVRDVTYGERFTAVWRLAKSCNRFS